jgi:hypothetical protein
MPPLRGAESNKLASKALSEEVGHLDEVGSAVATKAGNNLPREGMQLAIV